MGLTFVQKVLGNAVGKAVVPGEIVFVEPDLVLTHESSSAVVNKFASLFPDGSVKYPGRIALALGHIIAAVSGMTVVDYAEVRKFVQDQGIENFFEVGSGIFHQVLIEEHLVKPGSVVVGCSNHISTYGALNAFTKNIDVAQIADVWATGRIKLKVPETIEINLDGYFRRCVSAKDLILTVIRRLGAEGANGKAIEFHGSSVGGLLINERMTIANMGCEMGAEIAVFPADRIAQNYLCSEDACKRAEWSDIDAEFVDIHSFDLDVIVPMVAKPHNVNNVCPVSDLPETKVDVVCLGTCANGRVEELKAALQVMADKSVAPSVKMLVGLASRDEFLKALKLGLIEEFVKAGAIIVPPGSGSYHSVHSAILAPGEVCLSTASSNFKGRMGKDASIYLGSPETAAATAVTGVITDPRMC